MLQESTLSDYINEVQAHWVPEMPDGVPPMDICIPHEHPLFRLVKNIPATENDFVTHHEQSPNRDWGDLYVCSFASSMFDDLATVNRLTKMPNLKDSKAVARVILNPEDGVVKQTFRHHHYSWWKTNKFDINSAEIVLSL